MGVTGGDKHCPGQEHGRMGKSGEMRHEAPAPEMTPGASPRGEQTPEVSQLFCLARCCFLM